MRLHRFYTSQSVGSRTELTVKSRELVDQIRKVFRLKKGSEVILFDGSGSDYSCSIADFVGADSIVFNIQTSSRSAYMPTRKVYLYAAIIKKDNFETITEKATELGVTDIIPVIAERTEKKALNEPRLKKIAIEASEQSGRGDVPMIHPIVALRNAVESSRDASKILPIVFHTDGEIFDRDEVDTNQNVAVFIGPEGGWTPDEIDLFHRNEIAIRCLGRQVLRAETAVISALSQVVFRV